MQEVVEFLAKPDNLDGGAMPPGMETFDALPLFLAALPISTSVLVVNFVHELGHRIVALKKQVGSLERFLSPVGMTGSLNNVITQLFNLRGLRTVGMLRGQFSGLQVHRGIC